jgi:hypothetical protein
MWYSVIQTCIHPIIIIKVRAGNFSNKKFIMLLIRRVHLSAPPFANRLLRINRSLSTKSSASTAHELSPVMVNVEESADTHTFHTIGEAIPTNQLGNVPFIAIPRPGQPSRVETLIANLNKKVNMIKFYHNI